MITSFRQYRYYVEQDEQANGGKHRFLYIGDEIKKYLKLMRCREYIYYLNKRKPNAVLKIYDNYLRYRLHKLGVKLGFAIPINCAEPGLRIDHFGFVAINGKAKIGKNCHIYGDITIGQKSPDNDAAPIIGDNVVIGGGARIIGPVKIASNCMIGANAVVTHSFLEEGKNIAGVPAKVIN